MEVVGCFWNGCGSAGPLGSKRHALAWDEFSTGEIQGSLAVVARLDVCDDVHEWCALTSTSYVSGLSKMLAFLFTRAPGYALPLESSI